MKFSPLINPTKPNNLHSRVLNMSSRVKRHEQEKIRIDKLIKLTEPKILIKRRLGGIGDVIMTLPLATEIKRLLPNSHITYMTDTSYANGSLRDIAEHCPEIDLVISNGEDSQYTFDYSIDVTTTGLSRERANTTPPNRIDMFAEEAGLSVDHNPVPHYVITEEEEKRAKLFINKEILKTRKRENTNIIFLQPRSNDIRRTWPDKHVRELVRKLSKIDNIITLIFEWGGEIHKWDELANKNTIIIRDKATNDTAAIMKQCDLVICPDSSMLHLSGALNKKTVSIFGPIPPDSRINRYQNTEAVFVKLPCSFCFYTPKCLKRTADGSKLLCLEKITPDMVYNKVLDKLKEQEITYNHSTFVKRTSNKPILIRRSVRGIGDILMACNGIEAIKNIYPNKEVHVSVPSELIDIISTNPYIDKVLNCEDKINYTSYYKIIDISNPCSRYEVQRLRMKKPVEKNRVEIYAESMGVRSFIKDLLPRYYPKEEEIKTAKEYLSLRTNKKKKNVFVVLNSAEEYRNWPEENYIELFNLLNVYYNIIIASEKNYINTINTGKRSFREVCAFMKNCDLVLTVDTGPLHAAVAMKIPTVAIFGPIDYKARCKGYGSFITVIKSDYDCIPCWRNGVIECKRNNTHTSECLKNISGQKVFNIIKQRMENK